MSRKETMLARRANDLLARLHDAERADRKPVSSACFTIFRLDASKLFSPEGRSRSKKAKEQKSSFVRSLRRHH